MRNIALRVAYDGTEFVGSQWQQLGRSVQGELEGAWEQLTQERQRFTLAGRTDAGVHARGQVANVRTQTRHPLHTIRRAMNAILPQDVAVLDVSEVGAEFHARYSATRRSYRYLIDNAPVALPMLRHLTLHVEQPLDVEAMDAALRLLEGQHDFAAFATVGPEVRSTVRFCSLARCGYTEMLGRRLIAIDLAANAFLQHMVRTIVGTMVQVGHGKMTVERVGQVLKGRDRRAAGKTAAAHGLTLEDVAYPSDQLRWSTTLPSL